MYSCVLRINYTNLDIRILHTFMHQIDLCYTDSLHIHPYGRRELRTLNDMQFGAELSMEASSKT